jgi:glycyl-tRNA synthetase beta chain
VSRADFLIEIGTEELPPKALYTLMNAFAERLTAHVDEARLTHGTVHAYASPRRLAVCVEALALAQPDRVTTQKGPPVTVAFDQHGKPNAPAIAFAEKCGLAVAELSREVTPKGEWLSCELLEKGALTADIMPALVTKALGELPIPRRMRWGSGDTEFVRPVHWVVMLLGDQVLPARILDVPAGRHSRGHRFLATAPVSISEPANYLLALETDGHVIADFSRRRELVRNGVLAAATEAGGEVVDGESLYDEVAALVEWPVPVLGRFDDAYLALPREVVISTLTGHQRYFPVAHADGHLLPRFITVANIESTDPDKVRDGNERVIRPRLADAAFFWESDRKRTLASRIEQLRDVVYQRELGSLYDKSTRTAVIARAICEQLMVPADTAERAAMLAKCDLLTGMVGEFPELQGTMGQYYAAADGEAAAIADAVGEQYLPRFAGDQLPASFAGQALAVADKLDTIAGIFALGKKPGGNRDPFALRRAALGIVRILIECELDVDLNKLISAAVAVQPKHEQSATEAASEIYSFITDRLRNYLKDREPGLATETFDAVLLREPASLLDFSRRVAAVQSFVALKEAASLAAANKRIANILKKAELDTAGQVIKKHLVDVAEVTLHAALEESAATVRPLLQQRQYAEALKSLAALKDPVDRFFDEVLVMADDKALRTNRLALLAELRELFLEVADISRLAID